MKEDDVNNPDLSRSDEETLLATDTEDGDGILTPNSPESTSPVNREEVSPVNIERVPFADVSNKDFEFVRPRTPRNIRSSSLPPRSSETTSNRKESPVFQTIPRTRSIPVIDMSDSDSSCPSSIERAVRKRKSRSLFCSPSDSRSSSESSDTEGLSRRDLSGESTEYTGSKSEQERKKRDQEREAERVRLARIKKANERVRKEKERRERKERERIEKEEKAKREREEARTRRKQREEADRAKISKEQAEIKRLDKIRKQMEEDIRRLQRQEESIPRAHVAASSSSTASISDLPDPPPTIPGMYVDPETLTALISSIHKIAENQKSNNANSCPPVVQEEEVILTPQEKRLIALDKAYEVPSRHFPEYAENERLHGSRNYREWLKRITAEFGALNLTPFTKSAKAVGEVELSKGKRTMLDQMALTYLRSTVDKNVKHVLIDSITCFDALAIIHQLYQHNRIHDKVMLEAKFNSLRFKEGFNRERFTADFEMLIAQLEKNGEVFTPESKAVKFLEKIDGINNRNSPFWGFYEDITAKRPEKINYVYVKERFYGVRLTKESGTKRKSDDKNSESSEKKKHKPNDEKNSSNDTNKGKGQQKQKENRSDAKSGDKAPQSGLKYEPKKVEQWKARTLREKYSSDQLEQLKKMTREQKKAIQCTKCWEYFHTEATCKNPGPMCFVCKRYDHIAEKCKYFDEKLHGKYKQGKSKEN